MFGAFSLRGAWLVLNEDLFSTFSGTPLDPLSLGMRNKFLRNCVQSSVIAALWLDQDRIRNQLGILIKAHPF